MSEQRADTTERPPQGAPMRWWERVAGLDTRALSAWRIALGALVVLDVLWRALDLGAHYTDAGVFPRTSLTMVPPGGNAPTASLHALSGAWEWQALLFGLTGLAGLALMLGWKPRWSSLVCWALVTSMHAHNPLILHRGDVCLRLMLLWSMLLPLDRHWVAGAQANPARRWVGLATVGWMLQLGSLYWFSVIHKSDPIWRSEGSALYYALQLDDYLTGPGAWLGDVLATHTTLGMWMTFGVLAAEVAAPALLWSPWRTQWARALGVALGVGLHAGLLLTMRLDLFTWIMFAAWLPFVPSWVWDKLEGRAQAAPPWRGEDRAARVVAAAIVALTLAWNIHTVSTSWQAPPLLERAVRASGLVQEWSMFSPMPARDDGWFVIEGYTAEGRTLDLLREGAPARARKPARLDTHNLRWRKTLVHVQRDDHDIHRADYTDWLCQRWSERGVTHIDIVFYEEYTPPPGQPQEYIRQRLYTRDCAEPQGVWMWEEMWLEPREVLGPE